MHLIVKAGGRQVALSLQGIVETMRPQPTEALADMPAFVSGLARIRGEMVPVVDLSILLDQSGPPVGRFVTVDVAGRRVALAVESVLGVRELGGSLTEVPPLLRQSRPDLVEALGVLDSRLLMSLRTARILPPEVWASLERATHG